MHFTDTFIQSNLNWFQSIDYISSCVSWNLNHNLAAAILQFYRSFAFNCFFELFFNTITFRKYICMLLLDVSKWLPSFSRQKFDTRSPSQTLRYSEVEHKNKWLQWLKWCKSSTCPNFCWFPPDRASRQLLYVSVSQQSFVVFSDTLLLFFFFC